MNRFFQWFLNWTCLYSFSYHVTMLTTFNRLRLSDQSYFTFHKYGLSMKALWFCVEQMEVCYPHFCIIQLSLQIKISSYCSKTELRILLETFIRNSALRRHSILRLEHSLQLQWSHSFNEKLKQLRISCNSALLKEESFCKQKVQN